MQFSRSDTGRRSGASGIAGLVTPRAWPANVWPLVSRDSTGCAGLAPLFRYGSKLEFALPRRSRPRNSTNRSDTLTFGAAPFLVASPHTPPTSEWQISHRSTDIDQRALLSRQRSSMATLTKITDDSMSQAISFVARSLSKILGDTAKPRVTDGCSTVGHPRRITRGGSESGTTRSLCSTSHSTTSSSR